MRTWKSFGFGIILAGTLAGSAWAQTPPAGNQTQAQSGSANASPVVTVDEAIDRVIAREHDEIATIRRFSPVIETYIQDMKTDKEMGAIPVRDHYYSGASRPFERHRGPLDAGREKREVRRV